MKNFGLVLCEYKQKKVRIDKFERNKISRQSDYKTLRYITLSELSARQKLIVAVEDLLKFTCCRG